MGKWEVEELCLLIRGFKEGRGEVTGGGRLKKRRFIERAVEHGSEQWELSNTGRSHGPC